MTQLEAGCIGWALAMSERITGCRLSEAARAPFNPGRELARHGTLQRAVAARIGAPRPVSGAKPGDLVYAMVPIVASGHITVEALGVVLDYRAGFARRDGRMYRIPVRDCLGRWPACRVQR